MDEESQDHSLCSRHPDDKCPNCGECMACASAEGYACCYPEDY